MERAKKWIEEYRLALIFKDFKRYAALFTKDVEYYDEPFEHSIGDEESPNDEHFLLCDSMRNFLGDAETCTGDMEIICTNEDVAVYRFILSLGKESGDHNSFEFVIIVKFRGDLCYYYYQNWYLKT